MTKPDQAVKELFVMKGKVDAYCSIFSKVYDRIDNLTMDMFVEYGAALIAPLPTYIDKLSPLSAGAAEIIQRRLSDVRAEFTKTAKEYDKEGILRVFESVGRLYDDLELTLTTVEDVRKKSRPTKA